MAPLRKLFSGLYPRLLLAMVASNILILAIMTAVEQRNSQAHLTDDLINNGTGQARLLANGANLFVANADLRELSLLARTASSNDQTAYTAFFAANGDLLAAAAANGASPEARAPFTNLNLEPDRPISSSQRWVNGYLEIIEPVIYAYKPVGIVAIRLNTSELEADRSRAIVQGLITTLLVLIALSISVGLLFRQIIILPLRRLSTAAKLVGSGTWVAPRGQERQDEIGQVARSFGQMITALQTRETELQEQVLAVQTLNAELDARVAARTQELQNLVCAQEQLLAQIHEMSIPAVPVQDGVIAFPLIGTIDRERMARLIPSILAGIEEQHAHFVAIDITGVSMMDTPVVSALVQAAQAVRLMGARAALVGIRPEVAQLLVQLDVDFADLRTFATLQEALQSSLAHRR